MSVEMGSTTDINNSGGRGAARAAVVPTGVRDSRGGAHALRARVGLRGRDARAVLRPHFGRADESDGDAGVGAVGAHLGGARRGDDGGAAGGRHAGRRGAARAAAGAGGRAVRHAPGARPVRVQGGGAGGGAGRVPGAGELCVVGRAQRAAARLVAAAHRHIGGGHVARCGLADGRQYEPGAQLRACAVERRLGPPLGVLGGPAGRRRAVHGAVLRGVAPAARAALAAAQGSAPLLPALPVLPTAPLAPLSAAPDNSPCCPILDETT